MVAVKTPSNSSWTPARDAALKKMVLDGLSFRKIAENFNMSRSAVAGRMSRIGLRSLNPPNGSGRKKPDSKIDTTKSVASNTPAVQVSEVSETELAPQTETPMPHTVGLPLLRVPTFSCRGVVADEGMILFCCAPVTEGNSFCAAHRARYYARPTGTQRKSMAAIIKKYR